MLNLNAALPQDGTARPCAAPLSLLHPHVCIEPNSAAAEAYAEQQKARAKAKAKRRAQREKFKKEGEIDELNGTDMDQIKAESGGPVAMEDVRPELPNGPPSMVISDSITTVFEGHGGEVFTGSWWNGGSKGPSSSADSFLATGWVSI